MKKDTIIVVFSSHLSDDENNRFIEHISKTIGVNHSVFCYKNFNQYSLSEIYNRAIKEHYKPNSIMVFCHNDIVIKTNNWGRLLLTKFNNSDFSIIGVAGTTYLHDNGVWWHDRSKMFGVVEHTDGYNVWVNEYASPKVGYTKPVIVIDGLFMAVDCTNIMHLFDENFKGFHFYDLGFCFPNYLDGVNIGVTNDIRILHKSIGITNQEWEENRQLFIKKYDCDLPELYTQYYNYDILVNILTRTHNRPKHFKVCRESILNQTYKKINHIVGSDVDCDYYDKAIRLTINDVQYPQLMPEYNTYPAPWNLHLNELAKYVKDGWVMYLDDDDKFVHKNALKIIVNNIDSENELIVWRVKININEQGWIVPSDSAFSKKIEAGNVSGIGFMFHSKYLPVDWGSWSYGDYRVYMQLLNKGLKLKWIDLVLTETQDKPKNGK